MPATTVQFQTLTCDQCQTTVTFQAQQQGVAEQVLTEYPWLKTARNVATSDGRRFFYCKDECEIKAAGEGKHNPVEPSRIIAQAGPATVAQASAAAKASQDATEAIKSGRGGQVTL